eukprot:TRINITY_DN7065_c0_g1_i12.p1 TRINITY_DN7065_c0_g1~~TRINITY_DN7065_c0_g1_i12.p1  ORF type:complete len:228 (-),score=44.66 TRINITY_DN7065_c0_g1_i12:147-830(-)
MRKRLKVHLKKGQQKPLPREERSQKVISAGLLYTKLPISPLQKAAPVRTLTSEQPMKPLSQTGYYTDLCQSKRSFERERLTRSIHRLIKVAAKNYNFVNAPHRTTGLFQTHITLIKVSMKAARRSGNLGSVVESDVAARKKEQIIALLNEKRICLEKNAERVAKHRRGEDLPMLIRQAPFTTANCKGRVKLKFKADSIVKLKVHLMSKEELRSNYDSVKVNSQSLKL